MIFNYDVSDRLPAIANRDNSIGHCDAAGSNTWCRIATITITGTYVNVPLVFEISGRGRLFSTVQVMFKSVNGTDPDLDYFTSDVGNCYYIKKTATSTWEVYGNYNESYGSFTLHRITGAWAKMTVSVDMVNIGNTQPSSSTQVTGEKVSVTPEFLDSVYTDGSYAVNFPTANIQTNPSPRIQKDPIWFYDNTNSSVGAIRLSHETNGTYFFELMQRRGMSGGSTVFNTIKLGVDSSGNASVTITAPAWRRALGLNYAVNNTETLTGVVCVGVCTSSSAKIYINVTLPKFMEDISTITVTSINGSLRGPNGYIGYSSDTEWKNVSGISLSASKVSNNTVSIILTKSSAFTYQSGGATVANNSTVSYTGNISLKFT